MLARLDVLDGGFRSAHRHLDTAEATFTRGHMIEWLAPSYITRSAC